MKLMELFATDAEQHRLKLLKKNAKRAQEEAKVAQARLRIKNAQQELAAASIGDRSPSPSA